MRREDTPIYAKERVSGSQYQISIVEPHGFTVPLRRHLHRVELVGRS